MRLVLGSHWLPPPHSKKGGGSAPKASGPSRRQELYADRSADSTAVSGPRDASLPGCVLISYRSFYKVRERDRLPEENLFRILIL